MSRGKGILATISLVTLLASGGSLTLVPTALALSRNDKQVDEMLTKKGEWAKSGKYDSYCLTETQLRTLALLAQYSGLTKEQLLALDALDFLNVGNNYKNLLSVLKAFRDGYARGYEAFFATNDDQALRDAIPDYKGGFAHTELDYATLGHIEEVLATFPGLCITDPAQAKLIVDQHVDFFSFKGLADPREVPAAEADYPTLSFTFNNQAYCVSACQLSSDTLMVGANALTSLTEVASITGVIDQNAAVVDAQAITGGISFGVGRFKTDLNPFDVEKPHTK